MERICLVWNGSQGGCEYRNHGRPTLTSRLDHSKSPAYVCQILPVENMDGRELWEQGDLCRRKSASEVDLNRNYDFAWQLQVRGYKELTRPWTLSNLYIPSPSPSGEGQ